MQASYRLLRCRVRTGFACSMRSLRAPQLEVGRGVQEGLAELILQALQAVVPGGDALVAGQEVVLDLLVAVDVGEEVAALLYKA